MALWQIVRKTVFRKSQEAGYYNHESPNYFTSIYSGDETVFCLRVVFAEWTEYFILRASPSSFIRGLAYQLENKLAQWKAIAGSEIHDSNLPQGILKRLERCQTHLEKTNEIENENERVSLYLKFFECFKHELKLASVLPGIDMNHFGNLQVSTEIGDYYKPQLPELGVDQNVKIPSLIDEVNTTDTVKRMNELLNGIRQEIISFQPEMNALKLAIDRANYHYLYFVDPSKYFEQHLAPAYNRLACLTCFWTGGIHDVCNSKMILESKINSLLTSCTHVLNGIDRLLYFIERKQQLSAIGIAKFDIKCDFEQQIQHYSEELLNCIKEINSLITSLVGTYQEEPIKTLIARMTGPTLLESSIAPHIRPPHIFTFDFASLHTGLMNIKFSLFQKVALCIQTQPNQVKKTESGNFTSLRLHNLDNVFDSNPTERLNVYLLQEDAALQIKSRNTLPDIIAEAGRVKMADFSTTLTDENAKTRKRKRRKTASNENVTYSADRKHVNVNIDFSTYEPHRNGVDQKYVHRIKYVLLFVKEFVADGRRIKAWKMSLPMVIITHNSQAKDAWPIIAWSNAFPAKGNKFEDQTVEKSYVFEILIGMFHELVGIPLKHSHAEYIKKKLNDYVPGNEITWKNLFEDHLPDDGFSFWSWFFLATKVLGGNFKESFEKGYIEAFISWDNAARLLLKSQVKPGTFICRLSDSEEGSLSLIFIDQTGQPQRMRPWELHKNQGMKECAKAFLELLDAKYTAGGEAFKWVYPNIDKKTAFSKFYDYSSQFSPPNKKKHYVPLERSIAALSPEPSPSPPERRGSILESLRRDSEGNGNSLMEFEDDVPNLAQMYAEPGGGQVVVEPEGGLQGLVRDLLNYEKMFPLPINEV